MNKQAKLTSSVQSTHTVPVSIIVPCYNVEKYLPKCLDSLLNQTLQNVEVICINDGSPDHCIDILKEYKTRYPESLVIIDKKNEGVWKGRRDGIAIARGQYIGFVDSDDYVTPDFAEKLYACALENDADIAVCGFWRIDDTTGDKLTEEMSEPKPSFAVEREPARLLELNGAPWNKIFRASILKELPDLVHPPRIFDDMMMHLLAYPKAHTVAFTPHALVYYIIRDNSIMTTIGKEKIDSTYQAMLDVKASYQAQHATRALTTFLDAAAFLHFGVSLMFRISLDKSANLKQVIKENTHYLDEHFATWRTSAIISLRHALRYGGANAKLWFARIVYRLHLMRAALAVYRFMIEKLHKDIKW